MSFLFGRRKTPQEMLRQNQRALNKAMRDLDRERQHMEQQEKKIIADIKKMAKQGQMVLVCHLLHINRSTFLASSISSIRLQLCLTCWPIHYIWTIIMQLGQPQPGFANQIQALVESG